MPASVNCPGYMKVADRTIHCHKVSGHGALTFAEGLQQSCNVWFMTLGNLIGIDTYQQYVRAFGYKEPTGIDLPGEGSSIFSSDMTGLDLAIYAFGQNFNVTPMQQLCAVSAIANGGTLVTPYLVEKVTDSVGNVIYQHEVTVKRNVVSEKVCDELAKVLEEGVSGNGGAKNAYVAGYRVAAKTGTSEKKGAEFVDRDAYICSTVAFAPADDPEIAIIIIVDEPTKGVLYGSVVAAPYVAGVLENTLPYLGVEDRLTAAENEKRAIYVSSYRGDTVDQAIEQLVEQGLKYQIVGDRTQGDYVTSQSPSAGARMEKGGTVYLFVGDAKATKEIVVPDVTGRNAKQAEALLINAGLNVRLMGSSESMSGSDSAVSAQSIAAGTLVKKGTVVTLTFGENSDDVSPD